MKKTTPLLIGSIAAAALILFLFAEPDPPVKSWSFLDSDPVATKAGRADYFFRLMRDPATDAIPENIRSRELDYSRALPQRTQFPMRMKSASGAAVDLTWQSAGPDDVGGRTRALGIDRRNPDIIIAGGVSGGIWKSDDGGDTWELKTDPAQNMSVTSLAQDPGQPDTWYYTSGEIRGNSASDRGNRAGYDGTGIYRSTDNGESWSRIAATADDDNIWNSAFDRASRIAVSPVTGTVFTANNGFGIYRSGDGENFSLVLGGFGQHWYVDVAVAEDGTVAAALSTLDAGVAPTSPGIFISTDDGLTWSEVTPSTFPSSHERTVLAFAPSDPDIFYAMTYVSGQGSNEDVRLHYFDLGEDLSEDRTDNLPDFGGQTGYINTQINFNMALGVKPDDPDFVLLGGTNLFRSDDGFATTPTGGYDDFDSAQKDQYWIGGYTNGNSSFGSYPNHHSDQHALVFDPSNPDILWSGHDGALSKTLDVTADRVNWQDRDGGFVTSQFYTVALPGDPTDRRIMGGTQDNGTPFFRLDSQLRQSGSSTDISTGDGSYAFFGDSTLYTSVQNGILLRFRYDLAGDVDRFNWAVVHPSGATGQLFIHPYAMDPNDQRRIFYPGGTTMWRNDRVNEIPNFTTGGTTTGWQSFTAVSPGEYVISALEVSRQPANILYYGASANDFSPKILKVEHADTSTTPIDITIPGTPDGAYVHDIAVNPQNGDEVIVVLSNYGIVGLYRTTDGGENWEAIEGNLEGSDASPGPSLRSAAIVPLASGTVYLVGTSTGVWSTDAIAGSSTLWVHEATDLIGYAVSEMVTARPVDGTVAVGTHGRGIFTGSLPVSGEPDPDDITPPAAPAGPEISLGGSGTDLTWTANGESDLSKYRIWRGTSLAELTLHDSVGTATQYTDSEPGSGARFYALTAVDLNGNESPLSDPAAVYSVAHAVSGEWNLISTPTLSAADVTVTGGVQLVEFSGSYGVGSSLEPGKGYWVRSDGSDTIGMAGAAAIDAEIELRQGWNLIGSVADRVAVGSIADAGEILSETPVYEYNSGSYGSADTLDPALGYWIHAGSAGTIELSAGTAGKSAGAASGAENRDRMDGEITTDRLLFSTGSVRQSLLVSREPVEEEHRSFYLLPPVPPDPLLDVRTTEDSRLAHEERTELMITSATWPVTVSLESGQPIGSWHLETVIGTDTTWQEVGTGKDAVLAKNHGSVWLTRTVPGGAFNLFPNYPNPFQQSTTIRYQLSAADRVRLEVFDILGRSVRILVDEEQLPGSHTVPFSAEGLSSGTFLIRLQVGGETRIEKMTLVK